MDQAVHFRPTCGARRRNVGIRAVTEADYLMPGLSECLDVFGTILDVDIGTNLLLLLHKAEVYVRDAIVIEPVNGLTYSALVEVENEQAVRDDANACTIVRKKTKVLASSRDHSARLK